MAVDGRIAESGECQGSCRLNQAAMC
jgi:hypothetical protein